MNNNEIKIAEAINKDMGYMAGSEIINNQISVIIDKIDRMKVGYDLSELVMLSKELRELVIIRDELERREQFKKEQEEIERIRIYNATEGVTETLAKLGIQVFKSNGEFLGLENVLGQINKAFSELALVIK